MARNFVREGEASGGASPKKKKTEAENQRSNTQEEAETGFVRTLTPKQRAEYESLDENQRAIVKYVLGVPGVDVSKIDLSGNKQKETSAASFPPLPAGREAAHSGSGRTLSTAFLQAASAACSAQRSIRGRMAMAGVKTMMDGYARRTMGKKQPGRMIQTKKSRPKLSGRII